MMELVFQNAELDSLLSKLDSNVYLATNLVLNAKTLPITVSMGLRRPVLLDSQKLTHLTQTPTSVNKIAMLMDATNVLKEKLINAQSVLMENTTMSKLLAMIWMLPQELVNGSSLSIHLKSSDLQAKKNKDSLKF